MKYTSQLYVNTLDPFLVSGKETTYLLDVQISNKSSQS